MKKMIRYSLIAAIACLSMTGCTMWQDEWQECFPLPEANPVITPDPWEPPVTGEEPVGR